jgi:hypothetical protein
MATATHQWTKYMNTLRELIDAWEDRPDTHRAINEKFISLVNADPELKAFRDFVEGQNDTPVKIFGFGERSFIWMWKLLVDEMPEDFSFLEIGVFRGQILALVRMLSERADKLPNIVGITPLDSTGGHWESNYESDINFLHAYFKLTQPAIIKGLSTNDDIVKEAGKQSYDIIYIDGGHEYETVKADIKNYSPMVKPGGYLVIDDCCHRYSLPYGYFRGIESVSRAVDEVLPNERFKELFSVVHNRVFKRKTEE